MWLNSSGQEMTDDEWNTHYHRSLGVLLNGTLIDEADREGNKIIDQTFLLLLNAHHEPVNFVLPKPEGVNWELMIDTMDEEGFVEPPAFLELGTDVALQPRALLLLKLNPLQPSAGQNLTDSLKKKP
jgi:glycogen operon protein